jgi:hypothetical protein
MPRKQQGEDFSVEIDGGLLPDNQIGTFPFSRKVAPFAEGRAVSPGSGVARLGPQTVLENHNRGADATSDKKALPTAEYGSRQNESARSGQAFRRT